MPKPALVSADFIIPGGILNEDDDDCATPLLPAAAFVVVEG
jgi:hypothetical protein